MSLGTVCNVDVIRTELWCLLQVTIDVEIPPDIVILDPQARHGRGYNPQMSLAKRARLQATLDSDDEDYPFDLGKVIRLCFFMSQRSGAYCFWSL